MVITLLGLISFSVLSLSQLVNFHKNKSRRLFCLFVFCFLFFGCVGSWVFVAAHGLSLVVASRGLLFVVVRRLLIEMAPLVAEHGL